MDGRRALDNRQSSTATIMVTGAMLRASIQRHLPRRQLNASCRCYMNIIDAEDHSVTIGDITVEKPPRGSSPHLLVPDLPRLRKFHVNDGGNSILPQCHLSHLRWMMQKDLILRQDFLLLGPPTLARDR